MDVKVSYHPRLWYVHVILAFPLAHHGLRSTLITSQLPLESWHDFIADGTLADAILDRLVHNA
jgi:hypothetical protein